MNKLKHLNQSNLCTHSNIGERRERSYTNISMRLFGNLHARTKTVSIAFNGNVTSHVNNQTANHIHRTHKTCIFVTTNDRQPQQEKTTKTETKHTHTKCRAIKGQHERQPKKNDNNIIQRVKRLLAQKNATKNKYTSRIQIKINNFSIIDATI